MTRDVAPVEIADLFAEVPDWIDWDAVPVGACVYSRRGLPYLKAGRASAVNLFDDTDLDADPAGEEDVFSDWPYFAVSDHADPR